MDAARDGKEAGCPWFINDAGASFCWFRYMHENNGTPTSDSKIAQKLLLTDREVKKIANNLCNNPALVKALSE